MLNHYQLFLSYGIAPCIIWLQCQPLNLTASAVRGEMRLIYRWDKRPPLGIPLTFTRLLQYDNLHFQSTFYLSFYFAIFISTLYRSKNLSKRWDLFSMQFLQFMQISWAIFYMNELCRNFFWYMYIQSISKLHT